MSWKHRDVQYFGLDFIAKSLGKLADKQLKWLNSVKSFNLHMERCSPNLVCHGEHNIRFERI